MTSLIVSIFLISEFQGFRQSKWAFTFYAAFKRFEKGPDRPASVDRSIYIFSEEKLVEPRDCGSLNSNFHGRPNVLLRATNPPSILQPTPPSPPGTYHQPPSAFSHPIHVQPQFVTYASPLYPQSSNDQLRTLFVAGFPEDVKPREIYNLFREFPGYQSSNLRSPTSSNSQPFAFATFVDQQSAVMALQALSGIVFDLEKGSTLYIDLAKSNSRSKRYRSDDEGQSSEKRLKGSSTFERSYDPGVDSIHMPGIGNSAYNTIGYPSTQSFGSVDGGLVNAAAKSNNTPCPTIFVANLGPTCSEEELTHVFSRCHGFLKLKMQSTYGAPVSFVDFQDTACSTEALNCLQGTVLYSSTSGEGMRLEFAKSRMGMRSKKSR